ncbi:MAG: hypothetical protein AAGB46_07920 [Verrucomicrobiota bacterium]
MTEIIDQVQGLFEHYPKWLVIACLAIVGVGVGYVLWRVVKFGMMLVVALLLVALVGFAGWVIFSS